MSQVNSLYLPIFSTLPPQNSHGKRPPGSRSSATSLDRGSIPGFLIHILKKIGERKEKKTWVSQKIRVSHDFIWLISHAFVWFHHLKFNDVCYIACRRVMTFFFCMMMFVGVGWQSDPSEWEIFQQLRLKCQQCPVVAKHSKYMVYGCLLSSIPILEILKNRYSNPYEHGSIHEHLHAITLSFSDLFWVLYIDHVTWQWQK